MLCAIVVSQMRWDERDEIVTDYENEVSSPHSWWYLKSWLKANIGGKPPYEKGNLEIDPESFSYIKIVDGTVHRPTKKSLVAVDKNRARARGFCSYIYNWFSITGIVSKYKKSKASIINRRQTDKAVILYIKRKQVNIMIWIMRIIVY